MTWLRQEAALLQDIERCLAAADVVRTGKAYLDDPADGFPGPNAVPGFKILTRIRERLPDGRRVNVVVPIELANYTLFADVSRYIRSLGMEELRIAIDAFNSLPFEVRQERVRRDAKAR